MSFKNEAQRISDCEWLLERGVSKPISIFMNQKLYDASEEEMWRQATWATTIPSVEKIVITPDAHAGAGVPVGVVVATRDYIAPCASGYDISCFTEDTNVALADGRNISFKELITEYEQGKENFCFSLDNNQNVVIAKIEYPRKIRDVNKLLRITLDNNEIIPGSTFDHVFYARDNSEIKAKDLEIEQSLMPLYVEQVKDIPWSKRPSKIKKNLLMEYLAVYNPAKDKYEYIHFLADNYNIENNLYKKNIKGVRHHKDFNKFNNNPSNIERVKWAKHYKIHAKMARKLALEGKIGFKRAHKLYPEFYSRMGSENMTNLWKDPKFRKRRLKTSSENGKHITNTKWWKEVVCKDAGQRGKKYFLKYNKSEKGRAKSSEVAHLEHKCHLCKEIVIGGWGIINHLRQKHKKYVRNCKKNGKKLNHKITKIEVIKKRTPVYCLTTKYGNFALAAGVFVHNCGMISLKTKLTKEHIASKEIRRKWMDAIQEHIALGKGRDQMPRQYKVNDKKFREILVKGILAFESHNLDNFEKTHHEVREYVHYERAFNRGYYQLSSLGGGNHFLELQQDTEGKIWIMAHTGSRGYGHQIATDFFEEGLVYSEGKLQRKNKELVNFPINSDIGQRYLNAMRQAANFALVNRYLIAQAIIAVTEEIFKDVPEIVYEISHNLVQFESGLWVHRKGATRAFPKGHELLKGTVYENIGHPVLIPGSMGTASAILTPSDSAKSLYSVNHGCGRVMSRRKAKETLNQEVVDKEMDDMDILYNNRHVPIDESKHAYKNIDEVLETVEGADLAKVSVKLFPRAVIKGND